MFTFLNLIPKPVYALAVAALAALLFTVSWSLHREKNRYIKLEQAYTAYKLDAEQKARAAEAKVREVEIAATENTRRVIDEQEKRQAAMLADRAALLRANDGLRQQVAKFRAGIAADSKGGNTAALAARAATATKLLEACSGRYRELGEDAERVRLQAIGLRQYILGNPQCSAGSAAPPAH